MGTIRAEIKQGRPFAGPAEEFVVTLLRTADHVRGALSTVVEPRGATLQQYNVLRILRGAGTAGLPTLEIAARMIETSPGITRLLDRLEAKGLVRRERCPEDHRQVLCRTTAAALELLSALDAPMAAAAAQATGSLDARRMKQLVRLLDKVREDPRPPERDPRPRPPSGRNTKQGDRR
jgi:DNA-binding MarR family transcriptional regulator